VRSLANADASQTGVLAKTTYQLSSIATNSRVALIHSQMPRIVRVRNTYAISASRYRGSNERRPDDSIPTAIKPNTPLVRAPNAINMSFQVHFRPLTNRLRECIVALVSLCRFIFEFPENIRRPVAKPNLRKGSILPSNGIALVLSNVRHCSQIRGHVNRVLIALRDGRGAIFLSDCYSQYKRSGRARQSCRIVLLSTTRRC